jgi:hypothetical protein
MGSFLPLTMAVYGSEGWSTVLDWVEVMFSDFDFLSDVLFCLEAHHAYVAASDSGQLKGQLYSIWKASVAFIVIPVIINISIISLNLIGKYREDHEGIRKNIIALHKRIKPLLNPYFFLFYLILQVVNLLLIATSAERMAKIIIADRNDLNGIAFLNTCGFVLETFPQLICQGLFLTISGANTVTIVSVSISSYRTVSSYMFKVFHACFPTAVSP